MRGSSTLLIALIFLNLILVIFGIRFIVKFIFINYKESKSKLKNFTLILLLIIVFLVPMSTEYNAVNLEQRIKYLNSNLSTNSNMSIIGIGGTKINYAEETRRQLDEAEHKVTKVLIFTCLGYLSFFCLLRLDKSIVAEIKGSRQAKA
jgi:glucan phosphoethanolaminetransferase (alkaline phosphatase superfamily)